MRHELLKLPISAVIVMEVKTVRTSFRVVSHMHVFKVSGWTYHSTCLILILRRILAKIVKSHTIYGGTGKTA